MAQPETKTINTLTDALKQFSLDHEQLKDFGLGHTSNIGKSLEENRQLEYPYLWIDYSDTRYSIASVKGIYEKLYTMSITILDKYSPNVKNSSDVMSDTEGILSDVIHFFMTSQAIKDFRINLATLTAQPTRDGDTFGAEGWTTLISFKIPYHLCNSNLPVSI